MLHPLDDHYRAHRIAPFRCDAAICLLSGLRTSFRGARSCTRASKDEAIELEIVLNPRLHLLRRALLGEQPFLIAEILHLGDMQHGIVGFALPGVFLALEERQESIALAAG